MPKHRGLVCVSARGSILLGFIAALLLFAGTALAEDKEPSGVVELGGAGEWGLPNGGSRFGPTAAVEFTPIKSWLEIEAGVTPLFGGGHTDWGTDFLFKKPFNFVQFGGIRTRHWTAMEQRRQNCRCNSVRLHVLAVAGSKNRLVSRTKLQLHFQQRPRTVARHERRPAHCNPIAASRSEPQRYPRCAIMRLAGTWSSRRGVDFS